MTSSKGYQTTAGDDGQTLYLIGDQYVTHQEAAEYAQAEAAALAAQGDPAAYEGYPAEITPTYIAYATGTRNGLGADARISVYRKIVEAGQVMDEREIANWTGTEIDDGDGDLDTDAAEEQLGDLGWDITGAGWQSAGGGQMAIEVQPRNNGRPAADL